MTRRQLPECAVGFGVELDENVVPDFDAARARRGKRGRADRQRLRARSAQAAADGVRGRGAEAAGN